MHVLDYLWITYSNNKKWKFRVTLTPNTLTVRFQCNICAKPVSLSFFTVSSVGIAIFHFTSTSSDGRTSPFLRGSIRRSITPLDSTSYNIEVFRRTLCPVSGTIFFFCPRNYYHPTMQTVNINRNFVIQTEDESRKSLQIGADNATFSRLNFSLIAAFLPTRARAPTQSSRFIDRGIVTSKE